MIVLLFPASRSHGQDSGPVPSAAEMWSIIQQQQEEISALREQLDGTGETVESVRKTAETTRSEMSETREMAEATATAVEQGLEGFDSTPGWWERTSIGGYGELHANFFQDADNEIDFHRFVLFINHDFNERVQLFTELELEHSVAGEGQNGEIELEQAFVRFDLTDRTSLDTGLFLMPVGIINEIHEPTTFYGVERNRIDTRIIPTTWWEAGARGIYRMDNGVSVDAALTSGLDVDPTTGNIRAGRQKVSEAAFNEVAVSGRVRYTGVPGLDVGASVFYQNNMAQTTNGRTSGLLSVLHADYRRGVFGFRAQYARWDMNGDLLPPSAEEQQGFYLEPSARFAISDTVGDIGFFYRYSDYEFQADATTFSENRIHEVGVNYWPIDNVVFKWDLQNISDAEEFADKGDWATNLGLGFVF